MRARGFSTRFESSQVLLLRLGQLRRGSDEAGHRGVDRRDERDVVHARCKGHEEMAVAAVHNAAMACWMERPAKDR